MADPRRRAIITMALDERELARGLDAARRKVRKFDDDEDKANKRRRGRRGGKDKGPGALALGAVTGAADAAANAIGSFVTGTVDDLLEFENGLSRLQIAAGKTAPQMAELRSSILAISKDTGIAPKAILAGAQSYIDLTGDVAGAEAAMRSFARTAQATGADVTDIATATAAMQQSMQLDPRDIEAALSGLHQQGKAGAVAIKDLAGELSSVLPRFAKFGGSGLQGISDIGAALQIARKGFGSASEAATGLEALMGALSLNADKFQAAGVKIFKTGKDGKKTFRSFVDIIDAIGKSRLMKDPTALTKAWGSKEAAQAFDMLVNNREELEKLYQAGLDAGAVQRDLDTRLQSSAGKIEKAMNAAKISLAEAFTPERIEAFANALGKATEWFAKLVGFADKLVSSLDVMDMSSKANQDLRAEKASYGLTHDDNGKALSREEAKKRIQAAARGEKAGGFNMVMADTPELRKQAAAIAAAKLGLTSTGQEDPWANNGPANPTSKSTVRPNSAEALAKAQADPDMLARLIAKHMGIELSKLKIILQTDSNTTAKTVANAPVNRQPAKR
ncbi:MAG TPA: phage tail tape measure protein [Kofleriaceae bacterium]|nr:phage tail tape measure protein [Kofleriaceae bacterium]